MELLQNIISSRALPLINHANVLMYTLKDLIKPGPADLLQSALPLYQMLLISFVWIVILVVFIYFWKMVYYVVDDPYATPYGPSPPNWRSFNGISADKVLQYVYDSVFDYFKE